MTVEVFTWAPRTGLAGEETWRVRKTQFGDGYAQVTEDGINTARMKYPVTFVGTEAYIEPILAFLRRHRGARPFQWAPPLGKAALWRCEGVQVTSHGNGVHTLGATFEMHIHP